jgi:ABC-2 type transport system ATP-binding protein
MMIVARDLTRQFKTKAGFVDAVRGLSLTIAAGEMVAFLGPNGAGKSTSVRMLTTLLPPTSGTATVAGFELTSHPAEVRRKIGYVGQGSGAGQYYKMRDELLTQGAAMRMTPTAARKRADELIGMLELTGMEDRIGTTLSGGQKRRLDVALGLMHSPSLLFLDEPSTGLDPHSRANLWEHVLKLRRQSGMTIFLTTHYLEEADSMAERVMIMDNGYLIADDTPARLKADLAGDRISVSVSLSDEAAAAAMASNLPQAREVAAERGTITVSVREGEALLPEFVRRLHENGIDVATASVRRPTLDDVFLGLTGRSLRETGTAIAA